MWLDNVSRIVQEGLGSLESKEPAREGAKIQQGPLAKSKCQTWQGPNPPSNCF